MGSNGYKKNWHQNENRTGAFNEFPDIALENEIANEHRDMNFLFVGHFDDPKKKCSRVECCK